MEQGQGHVDCIDGYIVIAYDGKFLSRNKRWVQHPQLEKSLGSREAWVHSSAQIRAGGEWVAEADTLIFATYHPVKDETTILGKPMKFQDGMEKMQTFHNEMVRRS